MTVAELVEELLLGRDTAPRTAPAVEDAPDWVSLMVEADYAAERADYTP